jgi:hypothetical protein
MIRDILQLFNDQIPTVEGRNHFVTLRSDGLYQLGVWIGDQCFPVTLFRDDEDKEPAALVSEIINTIEEFTRASASNG